MYKPFMSCDDPKGVVECGTIRKYRTNSQKMSKDKTKGGCGGGRRPAEDTEESLTIRTDKEDKVSKGSSIERTFDSSSLQLMEVSRGAQRLNNMIDSWSRGLNYGGRSEDIAKDLLKGALDLQESLVMLRKVQEASRDVARSRRKQGKKPEEERVIDERAHSNRFSEERNSMGFQRPWPSADGYSSSSREELKKVIKESLVRRNLFPGISTEALDSASELHSTSSSQSSSMFQNERLSDSSFSPMNGRKEKGPSLVARLMGLEEEEEVTSRSFPTLMQKQLESEKIVNQKRPMFELDMPKVRKNDPIVHPERHKSKTLREILETNHFNGVLKSPARESKHQVPHYKQFDDLPPIVLIKPRCTPCREFARVHEPVPSEELSLRKLKAKLVSSGTFKQREGSNANMGKEMEEHVSKRLFKRERTELLIREVVEPEVKEIKPIENEKVPRGKVKVNGNANLKSQESETVDRKVKEKCSSKKALEKVILKHKVVTKSQDQGGEISSTKLRKPQSGSRIDMNEIPGKKSAALNSIFKTRNQKINSSKEQIKNQMKKQRSVAEPEAAKPVDEQLGKQEEEKTIDVQHKDDCTEVRIVDVIAEDLAIEHEVCASANKITEDCNQSQLKSEHENGNEDDSIKHGNKEEAELRYLLLNNQSFINHAEELLNLDLDSPKILPKIEIESDRVANPRLYLDCANELAERKSLQESQVVHPLLLLNSSGNSRFHISLGRLVGEICIAIQNLSSYSEIQSGKKLGSDNIYAMMERDINCNYGMMNGIWNWGWRHGFSADEAEQVVSEVERLVLSGLIEEVLVNL